MTITTFNKLMGILLPGVKRNYSMSRSAETVFPEPIVACRMRFLHGREVADHKEYFGLSRSEVYACRRTFVKAVMISEQF